MDELPDTFTLGDKKSYRGFYNRPLSPDLSYQCFVLASLKEPMDQVGLSGHDSQNPKTPGQSQTLGDPRSAFSLRRQHPRTRTALRTGIQPSIP